MGARGTLKKSNVKCACGCGGITSIIPCSCAGKGMVNGEPRKYIQGHNKSGKPRKTPAEWICKDCKAQLVRGENWSESLYRFANYRCNGCHQKRTADNFQKMKAERPEIIIIRAREYRNKHPQESAYTAYRSRAKKKKQRFTLSFEQFISYWNLPCVYCASPIRKIGLDRVDSSKGYEEGNVVPCCVICNRMKNSYTREFFIGHCRKIVDMEEKNGTANGTNCV